MALSARHAPAGSLAAAFLPLAGLAALCGVALVSLIVFARDAGGGLSALSEPYTWRIVRFTLWQAGWSTVLSVALALPVAVALFEHRHLAFVRGVLRLFALPLGLPQISAVLGIVALYGERGFLRQALEGIGVGLPSLYGLGGILIAHVFYNLPLAARIFVNALQSMPGDQERLAAQLAMPVSARLRHVYWPLLAGTVSGAAGIIFLLCVSSFAVVLTLGGGPAATTLEVAIYQALTFDFDISRAVVLTLLQFALTALAVIALARLGASATAGSGVSLARSAWRLRRTDPLAVLVVVLAAAFVAAPFIAIVLRGLAADLGRLAFDDTVHRAVLTSLLFSFAAASLAVLSALALASGATAMARARRFAGVQSLAERLVVNGPSLVLIVPPMVLGAGWFIALRATGHVLSAAPYLVIAVNAAMALPFALRFILPARMAVSRHHDRLMAQLGLGFASRWRLVYLPVLARPLTVGFAFAMALSLGDLGVIALFGSDQVQTLPYLILQRMGAYRTQDAAGLALLLCVLTMALMVIVDRGAAREGKTQ